MAKQPKKPAAKKKPATDWVAVLKSGAPGVRKWNRLTAAQRKAVKLAGADFAGADLTGANLSLVRAQGANFSNATLAGSRFDQAVVSRASFAGAKLMGASIFRTEADGADFSSAQFDPGTLLMGSSFRGASFAGTNLTRACFDASQLQGADFTSARLDDATWTGAEFDAETKWPAGFAIPGELKWVGRGTDPRLSGKGKKAVANDINGLMARLHATIDERRMKRTLDMLKKGKNQIYSEVEPALVRGIVRSQTEEDLVYSCVLTEDGTYSCATPDMAMCMGLSNEPCKHLLVLVIGLARAGGLDPATADKWVVAAKKNPRWNKTVQNHIADSFLKYKGAQAGEIDWRPTETIPEDYYAM